VQCLYKCLKVCVCVHVSICIQFQLNRVCFYVCVCVCVCVYAQVAMDFHGSADGTGLFVLCGVSV